MPVASNLQAIGVPPVQSEQLGYSNLTPIVAAGTTALTATVVKSLVTQIEVTASALNTGIRLPSDAEFQQPFFVLCSSATYAIVYPPAGGAIDGGATDAGLTLATNVAMVFVRIDRTRWVSVTSTPGNVGSISVATANGFAGSVTAAPTPAITLRTTQTGTVYGNGTALLGLPGTTSTVLHGNASGVPSFEQVALASEVSGTLPVGNGGWGTATIPTGRQAFSVPVYVADLTALAALSFSADASVVIVYNTSGRNGTFVKNTADLSSQVTNDTQQGIYVAPASSPTGASGAWVRIYNEALGIMGAWFGVVADGSTNDTTALQAAINFLPPAGGVVRLYGSMIFTTLSLASKTAISLIGTGAETAGANSSTVLRSTSGSATLIDCSSSIGIVLSGIYFNFTHASATFNGVDFSSGSYYKITNCNFNTVSVNGTAINLYPSTQGRISGCNFTVKSVALLLQTANALVACNVILVDNCHFNPTGTNYPIEGSGEAITFLACSFQASSNDGAGRAWETANSTLSKAINIIGCGFYDPTALATTLWLKVNACHGLVVHGNTAGGSVSAFTTFISLGSAADGVSAASIIGNRLSFFSHGIYFGGVVGSGTGTVNSVIGPNEMFGASSLYIDNYSSSTATRVILMPSKTNGSTEVGAAFNIGFGQPTSSAGLNSGDVYLNTNVLTAVP